jgi:A/G-specific adenine glycosylase
VLVSEILLAKTRAEVAAPVAQELLRRYPDAASLVRARRSSLERLLFPLGLHRKRTKHLRACAAALVQRHGGAVPDTVGELLELPFVGRYAANAVASVAFGQRRAVVDANVSRIYGRVFSLPPPPDRLSNAHDLWTLAERLLPRRRFKEFNWAVLDLGGTVCVAKNPACARCPIAAQCDSRSSMLPARRTEAGEGRLNQ